MQKSELLWKLYESERAMITHHENQRMTASNILAVISAGLVVAIGTEALTTEIKFLVSLLMVLIGLFGCIFSAKLYALIKLHAERSYRYLKVLDEDIASVEIKRFKEEAKLVNQRKFRYSNLFALHQIWHGFHLTICLTGLVLAVLTTV